MLRTAAIAVVLALIATAAGAFDVTLKGELTQGGMVVGSAVPGSRISLDGHDVPQADDGIFVLGFAREAAPTAELAVTAPDGRTERRTLNITRRTFPVQRIEGLPEAMVTPPPEIFERIKKEVALVSELRTKLSRVPYFLSGWSWPVVGPISSPFGGQRILNGKPNLPHYGVDIAAPAGSPVRTPVAGTVLLARELYLTGFTVIIDHGLGVNSAYSHLSKLEVKEGDKVRRGQIIGEVGATGRATGPHLDWRVNVFQVRVDPTLLAGPMPLPANPPTASTQAPR